MTKPEILSEQPISMVDLKQELEKIKQRDKELGIISNKTQEYLNQFVTLDSKKAQELKEKLEALKVSLDCFEEIGFEGLVVVVDGKVIAFSVFSQFKDLVYDIHFEKADINFKGAAQVINQETAKYLKGKCQYLNKEQDLGIKGLRQAKMSYEPEIMFVPYGLTFCDR